MGRFVAVLSISAGVAGLCLLGWLTYPDPPCQNKPLFTLQGSRFDCAVRSHAPDIPAVIAAR